MGQISETDNYLTKQLTDKNSFNIINTKNQTKMSTFSADDLLPSLPLPNLEDTLRVYLESVKPFLNDLEYLNTEKCVETFKNGVGKKLHFFLAERAKKQRNWLEQWWLDWAYLEWRMPTAPFINTCGYLTYKEMNQELKNDLQNNNIDIQLAAASNYIIQMCKFFMELRNETYPCQKMRQSGFLSMNQFRNLFNTCRIPLKNKDRLDVHFKTYNEGLCPTHFILIYKHRFFKIDAFNKENRLLTIGEAYEILKMISNKVKSFGIGIGALTGDYRDNWANNREYLIELDPKNLKYLNLIETSLFTAALDDTEVLTINDTAVLGLLSNPCNRFFDKSYTVILSKNGEVASNIEHSAFDGMVSQSLTAFMMENMKKLKLSSELILSSEKQLNLINQPEELDFLYDLKIENEVKNSIEIFKKFASNIELKTLALENCDKETLKSYKINPDTVSQMIMQLAYYQLHHKPAPTYETATTRQYYHGRTETVRSCTVEAIEWCKQMCNTNKLTRLNDKDLLELFRKACKKHDSLMNEAKENRGCDRHLLGLMLISKELNLDLPEIYKDVAWTKSGGGGNFLISSSCVGYIDSLGGCSPFCQNGYTMIYCFAKNGLTYSLARYKDSKETDLEKIQDSLKSAALQVQSLFGLSSKI